MNNSNASSEGKRDIGVRISLISVVYLKNAINIPYGMKIVLVKLTLLHNMICYNCITTSMYNYNVL